MLASTFSSGFGFMLRPPIHRLCVNVMDFKQRQVIDVLTLPHDWGNIPWSIFGRSDRHNFSVGWLSSGTGSRATRSDSDKRSEIIGNWVACYTFLILQVDVMFQRKGLLSCPLFYRSPSATFTKALVAHTRTNAHSCLLTFRKTGDLRFGCLDGRRMARRRD
jgi:hypothetical protein